MVNPRYLAGNAEEEEETKNAAFATKPHFHATEKSSDIVFLFVVVNGRAVYPKNTSQK